MLQLNIKIAIPILPVQVIKNVVKFLTASCLVLNQNRLNSHCYFLAEVLTVNTVFIPRNCKTRKTTTLSVSSHSGQDYLVEHRIDGMVPRQYVFHEKIVF